jgi:predicted dehydrogenase
MSLKEQAPTEDRLPLTGVIIGAGYFADIQLEAWQSVKGARIHAVMSLSREQSEALAGKYRLEVFDDYDRMIAEAKPDFVDICTPPDSHEYYTRLTADRKLPVLCQKPLAPSCEECRRIINYCSQRNVPFMVNENWRWQGWYREMKRMIEKGMLGNVYHAYFAMRPGDGWGQSPYPVQPYFSKMRRFLLYETGIHWIDTYRFLFGELKSVYCQTRKINSSIAGEDLAVVHFNFTNGMTGIYDANRTTYMEEVRTLAYGWMTLEGTDGKLRLEPDGTIYYTPRDGREHRHHYEIPQGWKGGSAIAAQQHFIDGLLNGTPYETSGEQYLKSVRAMFACYESAEKNQVVFLST